MPKPFSEKNSSGTIKPIGWRIRGFIPFLRVFARKWQRDWNTKSLTTIPQSIALTITLRGHPPSAEFEFAKKPLQKILSRWENHIFLRWIFMGDETVKIGSKSKKKWVLCNINLINQKTKTSSCVLARHPATLINSALLDPKEIISEYVFVKNWSLHYGMRCFDEEEHCYFVMKERASKSSDNNIRTITLTTWVKKRKKWKRTRYHWGLRWYISTRTQEIHLKETKKEASLITAVNTSNRNTRENRITITRKQKLEEKEMYAFFKIQTGILHTKKVWNGSKG